MGLSSLIPFPEFRIFTAMNIFIIPDHAPEHPHMMAPSLSQFFEMQLGWESESEAEQIGKLIGLDLSPYKKFAKETEVKNAVWQDLSAVIDLTQQFIAKLKADPELYKRIQYSAMPQSHLQEQLLRLTLEGEKEKIKAFVKEWQHTPDSQFPPEIGYVRRGFLLEDLVQLEKMLQELAKDGAQKIQLHYY
jgi:hypothetical protein